MEWWVVGLCLPGREHRYVSFGQEYEEACRYASSFAGQGIKAFLWDLMAPGVP